MRVMIIIKRDEVNVLQRVSGLPLQILAWGGDMSPWGGPKGRNKGLINNTMVQIGHKNP